MEHLPAPIARVRTAVREFLTQRRNDGHLPKGGTVAVACSGGADSVALAQALSFVAPRMGIQGALVTVDHGMQKGSREQSENVQRLGLTLGLEPSLIYEGQPNVGEGLGPEGQARELRYEALQRAIAEVPLAGVLLGHTMEDQAETVLLGLSRGAGTRAVAGMAPVREKFWRPLLQVRRADTEAVCELLDLPVWEDPTNAPDGPWRTKAGAPLPRAALRHHAIPELGRALGQDPIPALARTAELARRDCELLDELAAEQATAIQKPIAAEVHQTPGAVAVIEVAAVENLPPALRWRVLRELAIRAGAPEAQMSMRHVYGLDRLLTHWRGQYGASLPGGLHGRRVYGRLYIVTPPNLEQTP